MKQKFDWDILLRCLEGDCTEFEKESVEAWKNESDSNRAEFERVKKIWSSPDVPHPKPDVDFALTRVWQKIDEMDATAEKPESSFSLFFDNIFSAIFATSPAIKFGTAFLIAIGLYFVFSPSTSQQLNELLVADTQMEKIILSDGSTVTLDAGSKFSYPEQFAQNKREVNLTGEAYFEIEANADKPFIINAKEGVITVLGTKFNVRAIDESDNVVVSVTEGIVSLVNSIYDGNDLQVTINAGFKSIMQKDSPPAAPIKYNTAEANSWMNREMAFTSAPLSEVLKQLTRWYGLQFEIPLETLPTERVTVFLKNQPVEETIEMIALVINKQYSIDGSLVKFYADKN